jgi:hypothetical protein
MFRPASSRGAMQTKLKMSQTAFAARFGILPSVTRSGTESTPSRWSSARLLTVIDKEPDAVNDMKDGPWPSVTARCATSSESRSATDRATRWVLQNEADVTRKTRISEASLSTQSRMTKAFYLALGFEPSPIEPMTFMVTLGDIRKSFA